MRYQRPSTEDETGRSLYGEANNASESAHDERELYGEPCHEVDSQHDEQALYGDPQHEIPETPDLPDIDLLLARMRAKPDTEPTVMATRETSAAAETTER